LSSSLVPLYLLWLSKIFLTINARLKAKTHLFFSTYVARLQVIVVCFCLSFSHAQYFLSLFLSLSLSFSLNLDNMKITTACCVSNQVQTIKNQIKFFLTNQRTFKSQNASFLFHLCCASTSDSRIAVCFYLSFCTRNIFFLFSLALFSLNMKITPVCCVSNQVQTIKKTNKIWT
jgi:hypothetical protein